LEVWTVIINLQFLEQKGEAVISDINDLGGVGDVFSRADVLDPVLPTPPNMCNGGSDGVLKTREPNSESEPSCKLVIGDLLDPLEPEPVEVVVVVQGPVLLPEHFQGKVQVLELFGGLIADHL